MQPRSRRMLLLPAGFIAVHCCMELLNNSLSDYSRTVCCCSCGNRNTTHYFCAEVPSLAAILSVLIRYRIAMLVHKCVNRRPPQYLICDCSWADGRRSGHRVQAVEFWKSSGTTQPSVTGHSLVLC